MASACTSERGHICMVSGTSEMRGRGAYLELLCVGAAVGREEPGVDAYADASRNAGQRHRALREPLYAEDSIGRVPKHAEAESDHAFRQSASREYHNVMGHEPSDRSQLSCTQERRSDSVQKGIYKMLTEAPAASHSLHSRFNIAS